MFHVIDLLSSDCESALLLPIDDYKDVVATVCARKARIETIITRDEKFIQTHLKPAAVSPQDFIKNLKKEPD